MLVTVRQAAKRVRIAPERIRAAIRAGELPGYQTGSRWVRVDLDELERWLRCHVVEPLTTDQQRRVKEIAAKIRGKP